MIPVWVIGLGSIALFTGWSAFMYDKGGDARETRIALDAAVATNEAKEADDAVQTEAASEASLALANEVRRLRQSLKENSRVTSGSDCGLAGDGDRVFDTYDELFGEGLPPGD